MSEINSIFSGITGSAQQQAAGLMQLNSSFNQFNEINRANTNMVQQSTGSALILDAGTGELMDLVNKFELNGHPNTKRRKDGQPALYSA